MRFDRPTHDREAQAHSPRLLRASLVDAVEALKHFRLMFQRNAGSVIDNFNYGVAFVARYPYENCFARRRILDRIIKEVHERLTQDQTIPRYHCSFITLNNELLLLFFSEYLQKTSGFSSHLQQREVGPLQ